MKYFSLFLLLSLFAQTAWAQEGIAICGLTDAENTELFASLADDPSFQAKHDLVAYTHENARGEEINFATPDGQEGTAYYLEAKEESNQYLFVIHEWWGLNDHIKQEAEKLHKDLENVHVMALDIYDGKVATTRELAQKYMQSVSTDRAKAIINGAIQHAGEDAGIATIGWCFGGGWSLQSTILADEKAIGCVMYYGMPVQEMAQIEEIETDVLGIFAEYDGYITPQVVDDFEEKMNEADKNITVHMYDADHGFANPSGTRYDEDAAKDAYDKTIAFLRERLN